MKIELTTLVTIILIYISGSIFFIEYLYPISYIVVFVVFYILNLLKNNKKMNSIDVIFITLLIVLNLITLLISNNSDISSYLGFLTALSIAFIVSRLLTKANFVSSYSKIITILSFISVMFFVFGLLYPEVIANNFTLIKGKSGIDYYNLYLHVYQYSENASLLFNKVYIDPRNSSIFSEPGVLQAFININIYFILKNIDYNPRKKIILLIINIVALITTYSITGFFILIFIIIEYFYKLIKYEKYKRKTNILVILIIILIILFVFTLGGLDIILARIVEYGDNINDFVNAIITRTYFYNLSVFKDKIQYLFFGFGYNYFRNPNANSIVEMMITNGLLFSSLLLIYLWYKIKKCFKSSTLLLIFLLIFLTEPLLLRPFFLLFLFLSEEK